MLGFLSATAIALRHGLGWYPSCMHLLISAKMWDLPGSLVQAHLRTWYVICEWPGAVFELFLCMASWISSLVRVWYGRSSGDLVSRSGG